MHRGRSTSRASGPTAIFSMYTHGPGLNIEPRSATAITAIALLRPSDVSVVPSIGSTAMSHGRAAGADLLAVEEHRRFVLLALADDDDAVHRHRVEHEPHGVDRGLVGRFLVAAADPAGGGEGGGLGDAGEVHRQVAVRGLRLLHGCAPRRGTGRGATRQGDERPRSWPERGGEAYVPAIATYVGDVTTEGGAGAGVVIVTGPASGIGRATAGACAGRLVRRGVRRRRRRAGRAAGPRCRAVVARGRRHEHGSRERESRRGRARPLRATGRAVLNAAVSGSAGALDDQPIEDVDRMLAINLRGVVLGAARCVPALLACTAAARSSSPPRCRGQFGDPVMWAYNASKGGVINFVRSAAIDLAREGIRVNAVCPGPIARDRDDQARWSTTPLTLYEEMRSHVPLRGGGEPDEVAAAIAWLLSDDASLRHRCRRSRSTAVSPRAPA